MNSFLEDIANQYAGLGPSLEHYCFVLPSKRAGNFLRNHLKDAMIQTVFAPKITSIEVFVGELANLAYVSEEQQLFRLYEIYRSLDPDPLESFADFCSWAKILLNDYSEIDQYLVDAKKLFAYLEDYKKLSEWNPNNEPNEVLSSYITFWNSLYPMYKALNESLAEEQLGTRGMIYRRAALGASSYLANHPKTKYVFIGFNALNKAEEQLIQTFLTKGRSKIHWDIDTYLLNDEYHDAGYFIRSYKQKWEVLKKEGLQGVSDFLGKKKKSIELIGLPMNVSQAQYTGDLLSRLTKEDLKNTALILGVEESLNLVLNALPKDLLPNITMGYSLARSKVASFVALMFEIHRLSSSGSFRANDCFKLLLHPLSKQHYNTTYAAQMDDLVSEMRKLNLSYWNSTELNDLNSEASNYFELLFSKELQQPLKFVKAIQAILNELKSIAQGTNNRSLETELIYIETLFVKLEVWVNNYEFIDSLSALEQLYQGMLSKTQNYFKGEAMEGLQIMGMLESRNLDFETVILTNLNEGILPGGKKQSSHLPYQLKQMYGLPTYKERDAIFTYHFYRLLQRTKKAYLIYNIEPEVLEGREPSRFKAQLESDAVLKKFVTKKIISPSLKTEQKEALSIDKSQEDLDQLRAKLERGTSSTLLTSYLWNPIDFYHKYLLQIKEQPELETQIPHNIFGSIVHDSLEVLYKEFVGKRLVAEELQLLFPKVKQVVNHFYEEHFVPLDTNSGRNIIAYEVIVNYVTSYVRMDISASKKQELYLVALEEEYQMNLELKDLGITLNCQGKFDRIEKRNGMLTIIDYKTGKVNPTDLKVKSWDDLSTEYKCAKQFQLLFYSMIYMNQHQVDELHAGIFSFKNIKNGLMLFKEDKSSSINRETISKFKQQLTNLISELLDLKQAFVEKINEK